MGYAAATGGDVTGGTPLALVSLLFLWQFPHFFALSWLHREDYARGGFQMVAVNDPLGTRSVIVMCAYGDGGSVLCLGCEWGVCWVCVYGVCACIFIYVSVCVFLCV